MGGARKPSTGATVAQVRALALALDGTVEKPSYGTPGFRVRDTLFVRVIDDATIVAKVDLVWRDTLIESAPETFTVTDHYRPHPWIVVRLSAITRARLAAVLRDAWQLAGGAGRKPRTVRR